MSSRKPHLKSRNGCVKCKARKIKCNETYPSCGPCLKSGARCSFTPPSPPLTPLCKPTELCGFPTLPHMLDLELFHHFTTKTYLTISSRPEVQALYQHEVVKEALEHDYLMHSMLAVSAFHLVRLRHLDQLNQSPCLDTTSQCSSQNLDPKTQSYLLAAQAHYSTALRLFSQALTSEISPSNSDALFIGAALTVVAALGCLRNSSSDDLRSSLLLNGPPLSLSATPGNSESKVFGWLHLARGVNSVISPVLETVLQGNMREMTLIGKASVGYETLNVELDHDLATQLDQVSSLITTSLYLYPREKQIISEALQTLRKYFLMINTREDSEWGLGIGLMWPAVISTDYSILLDQKKAAALVVLGYYCVMIGRNDRKCWWMDGCAELMLREIWWMLDACECSRVKEWKGRVEWCMKKIGINYEDMISTESLGEISKSQLNGDVEAAMGYLNMIE